MPARVILLAGPSGAGKSRLSHRLEQPTVQLDDFYREGADPALPRIATGANAGMADWDHPASWDADLALRTLVDLCTHGHAELPIYDASQDGRTGWQRLDLQGSPYVVAEGLFADDLVRPLAERGLLAAAYCIRQQRVLTFWRRLVRDLRERRKPPVVLLRRGVVLMRAHGSVVRRAVAAGCQPVTPDQAARRIRRLVSPPPALRPFGAILSQPDRFSCGAAVAVMAAQLADVAPGTQSASPPPEAFEEAVLRMHRLLTRVVDGEGRWQPPWPRPLGTPPWALARQLSTPDARYVVRPVWPWARATGLGLVRRALAQGHPVAVYLGSAWLPRHVALITEDQGERLRVYEPGSGTLVDLPADGFTSATLGIDGWDIPWFLVLPDSA